MSEFGNQKISVCQSKHRHMGLLCEGLASYFFTHARIHKTKYLFKLFKVKVQGVSYTSAHHHLRPPLHFLRQHLHIAYYYHHLRY